MHATVLLACAGLVTLALGAACSEEESGGAQPAAGGAGGQGGSVGVACPDSGVLYGPWALHFDTTSVTIRWDACAPGSAAITVEPEAGGPAQTFEGTQTAGEVLTTYDLINSVEPDLPGMRYLTEVVASGLEAGRCYRYQLTADSSRQGRFCTARPAGESFSFFVIGDTNPTVGDAAGVLEHAMKPEADFTVHTGDIQYYASVIESWALWFPAMRPLLRQGAFLPCIGNHEGEIEHEFDDYYVRTFGGAGFDSDVVEYYRYQSGGVWFFSLDTEIDLGAGSAQADWLEAQLADAAGQPGYRFSVVYLHRPMITLSEYSQKSGERQHFAPIFEQYGVKLVFMGHVHGYERFVDGPLTYVVTGGGGAALHDLNVNIDDRPEEAAMRQAFAERYHGVAVDVRADSIDLAAIANDGEVLDTFSIPLGAGGAGGGAGGSGGSGGSG